MVSASLRIPAIVMWTVLVPLAMFALEVRLTAHWEAPVSVDVFALLLVLVPTLVGGAALFYIRTSFAQARDRLCDIHVPSERRSALSTSVCPLQLTRLAVMPPDPSNQALQPTPRALAS